MTDADLAAVGPAMILGAGATAAAFLSLSVRIGVRTLGWLGAGVSIGAAATAVAIGAGASGFGGTVARDGASLFLVSLVGAIAAASLVLVAADPRRTGGSVDSVPLALFSACGAALLVSAADLLVLFVGLALLTVPRYVLTGRQTHRGDERAIGHFLLGAASTAVALYGIALLYSATGTTAYAGLGRATHNPLYLGGLALALAGLASHVVLAPAHRWSVVANVATIGALLRLVFATRSGDVALDWEVSLATLAAVALAIAGLAALTERRVRWLVGYATVSQLGYIAVAAAGFAVPAAAFSLAVYAALAVGLFAVLAVLPHDEPVLDDLAGIARQRPVLVLALGVFVLTLIGIPPTAGFIAKLYVFEAAVRAQLLWLVVLGALASVASTASYLRIVLACFAPPRLDAVAPERARVATVVVLFAAFAVVVIGVLPGPLLEAAQAVRF